MKKSILFISFLIISITTSSAQKETLDLVRFAHTYFNAWNKTQAPEASETDLENYLAILTNDVALQHLPYNKTDERKPNGKEVLRKGMSRWRGVNTSYKAKLIEVNHGQNVVIIKYQAIMTFLDEKTKKERSITRNNIEVLELDKGKVAIIRKYGKY
tara:strand:+ start:24592 stop:25062 length:471 start_codon:yes stop_codon:yes gene_type:complete